jgi:hypothetical protein
MTLDRDDIEAIADAVVRKLAEQKPPQLPATPGSFLARRQAALDELDRKTGGGRK